MKHFAFWATAVLAFVGGWFFLSVPWTYGHRYEITGPGWRYGHISGSVFPNSSELDDGFAIFSLGIKSKSVAAWYWRVPTNFVYTRFELQTGLENGENWKTNYVSVELPSLAYRANSSTGILDGITLRRFLVDPNAPASVRPTAVDCDWIIEMLKLAHDGTFPRPRHHSIKTEDFANSGSPPPSDFDISFHHFDLGMGFPWPFWAWLFTWGVLVWFAGRKWLKRRST